MYLADKICKQQDLLRQDLVGISKDLIEELAGLRQSCTEDFEKQIKIVQHTLLSRINRARSTVSRSEVSGSYSNKSRRRVANTMKCNVTMARIVLMKLMYITLFSSLKL